MLYLRQAFNLFKFPIELLITGYINEFFIDLNYSFLK